MTKSELKTLEMIHKNLKDMLEKEDLKSEKSIGKCITSVLDAIYSLEHLINYQKDVKAGIYKINYEKESAKTPENYNKRTFYSELVGKLGVYTKNT